MSKSLKEKREYSKQEVLDILSSFLQENMELSLREMRDKTKFEQPSWSEYQAYQLGLQKAYQKVIDFLP